MENIEQDVLYSTPEAANHCGVSIATIYRWKSMGLIKGFRKPGGSTLYFRESQLDAIINGKVDTGQPSLMLPAIPVANGNSVMQLANLGIIGFQQFLDIVDRESMAAKDRAEALNKVASGIIDGQQRQQQDGGGKSLQDIGDALDGFDQIKEQLNGK